MSAGLHRRRAVAGGSLTLLEELLLDAPYAVWGLGETSGNMLDLSGNARHLPNTPIAGNRGKPGLVPGGLCAQFPGGTSGAAWSSTITGFTGDNAYGLFGVCKPAVAATNWILHNGNTGAGGSQGSLLGIDNAGRMLVWLHTSSGWSQMTGSTAVCAVGETALVGWYHDPVANTITLWKNGTLVQTIAFSLGGGNGNNDWTIGGANRGSGGAFNGHLQFVTAFRNVTNPAARFLAHAKAAGLA